MPAADRLPALLAQNAVTGIDYVQVEPNQTRLHVVFFTHDNPPQADAILTALNQEDIHIYAPFGADQMPEVALAVAPVWQVIEGRTVLQLDTESPGDFTRYRLNIVDARVDPYFNDVAFSFKVNCESDLDCKPPAPDCGAADRIDFGVDYLARDFASFRQSLLEFASVRYPQWEDRLEADVGIMMTEVASAVGDELAYYQGRISREAYLETASQRRSISRLARLVDYHMHEGCAASGWLVLIAAAGESGTLPAGTVVQAIADNSEAIDYEIGRGLQEVLANQDYAITDRLNELRPHIWDEDDLCLPKGSREIFVVGHFGTDIVFDHPPDNPTGKWMVLETTTATSTPCATRHLIKVTVVEEARDELFGVDLTRLAWTAEYALPQEYPLESLTVYANVVPVTAGRTLEHRFVIGEDPTSLGLSAADTASLTRAIERQGTNRNIRYLQSLPDLQDDGLVYLTDAAEAQVADLLFSEPEVHLREIRHNGIGWEVVPSSWEWRHSLLGVNSSQPVDRHFTIEPGTWGRTVGYWRKGVEKVYYDYRDNAGKTLVFGDGEFARLPAQGTIFSVLYRVGNGAKTNVAPDAIHNMASPLPLIERLFNPFVLDNALDPETEADVRSFAPHAFRQLTYRAVRQEDYAEAAERLDWVQRAGASERWTGSWLSIFATPDPENQSNTNNALASPEQLLQLDAQLDRFRQAGREVNLNQPRFANLDLRIRICVLPNAFTGDVKQRLSMLLLGPQGKASDSGYFAADNFTFGTPLRRAQLEAVIHRCEGVRAVLDIQVRRRGHFDWRKLRELEFQVGLDEVIRLENDPLFPARGSLELIMEGGA